MLAMFVQLPFMYLCSDKSTPYCYERVRSSNVSTSYFGLLSSSVRRLNNMAKSTSPSSKAVAQVIEPKGMTAGSKIYQLAKHVLEQVKLY